MTELVEDPGYAGALLGAFGPALIDRTGSRPAGAAERHRLAGAARIRHPRELRAILEQRHPAAARLVREHAARDWGTAAARHPETFEEFLTGTARASVELSTSPAMRWRIPTATCCARSC